MALRIQTYSLAQKLLHWTIAALVLAQLGGGIVMASLGDGPAKDQLYSLHKSFGIVILALMLARLGLRLTRGVPRPEPTLTRLQCEVSRVVHGAFYPLLLAMPIIGWAATSAYGAPVPLFGLFDMPPLVAKNEALAKVLFQTHALLGFATAALAAMHIGAALYHRLIRQDGVFSRMALRL